MGVTDALQSATKARLSLEKEKLTF